MTIQECYAAFGGDFQDVFNRLMKSERMVQKFVLKFLDDGSFDLLVNSMECKNYDDAFRAAHTIKGMCQNLSFTELERSSSELTEALRGGNCAPEAEVLLQQVKADYAKVVSAIQEYKNSLPQV